MSYKENSLGGPYVVQYVPFEHSARNERIRKAYYLYLSDNMDALKKINFPVLISDLSGFSSYNNLGVNFDKINKLKSELTLYHNLKDNLCVKLTVNSDQLPQLNWILLQPECNTKNLLAELTIYLLPDAIYEASLPTIFKFVPTVLITTEAMRVSHSCLDSIIVAQKNAGIDSILTKISFKGLTLTEEALIKIGQIFPPESKHAALVTVSDEDELIVKNIFTPNSVTKDISSQPSIPSVGLVDFLKKSAHLKLSAAVLLNDVVRGLDGSIYALGFNGNKILPSTLVHLDDLLTSLPEITELNFGEITVTDAKILIALLEMIARHKKIQCLSLNKCDLDDQYIDVIIKFLTRNQPSVALYLSKTKFTSQGLNRLAQALWQHNNLNIHLRISDRTPLLTKFIDKANQSKTLKDEVIEVTSTLENINSRLSHALSIRDFEQIIKIQELVKTLFRTTMRHTEFRYPTDKEADALRQRVKNALIEVVKASAAYSTATNNVDKAKKCFEATQLLEEVITEAGLPPVPAVIYDRYGLLWVNNWAQQMARSDNMLALKKCHEQPLPVIAKLSVGAQLQAFKLYAEALLSLGARIRGDIYTGKEIYGDSTVLRNLLVSLIPEKEYGRIAQEVLFNIFKEKIIFDIAGVLGIEKLTLEKDYSIVNSATVGMFLKNVGAAIDCQMLYKTIDDFLKQSAGVIFFGREYKITNALKVLLRAWHPHILDVANGMSEPKHSMTPDSSAPSAACSSSSAYCFAALTGPVVLSDASSSCSASARPPSPVAYTDFVEPELAATMPASYDYSQQHAVAMDHMPEPSAPPPAYSESVSSSSPKVDNEVSIAQAVSIEEEQQVDLSAMPSVPSHAPGRHLKSPAAKLMLGS